jgi:hypothetical protein
MIILLISGAIVMGYWVAGLFFLRFWRRSGDRLFATFAVAFWMLGLQRIMLAARPASSEESGWIYLVRLLAFVIILAGIVDKNRSAATVADGGMTDSESGSAVRRPTRKP